VSLPSRRDELATIAHPADESSNAFGQRRALEPTLTLVSRPNRAQK
jgi:hypothetical protein